MCAVTFAFPCNVMWFSELVDLFFCNKKEALVGLLGDRTLNAVLTSRN